MLSISETYQSIYVLFIQQWTLFWEAEKAYPSRPLLIIQWIKVPPKPKRVYTSSTVIPTKVSNASCYKPCQYQILVRLH